MESECFWIFLGVWVKVDSLLCRFNEGLFEMPVHIFGAAILTREGSSKRGYILRNFLEEFNLSIRLLCVSSGGYVDILRSKLSGCRIYDSESEQVAL